MKHLLLVAAFILSAVAPMQGQTMALASAHAAIDVSSPAAMGFAAPARKHANYTVAFVGVAATAAGAGLLLYGLADQYASYNENGLVDPAENNRAKVFIGTGVALFVGGGILMIAGFGHAHQMKKMSVIAPKRNEVGFGFAYNF